VHIVGGVLLPNAVKLAVTASVPMECKFRTEDDGWKGACVELSIAVHGSNFEDAKKNMEAALQTAVESVLRDRKLAA
jgi:predicted RNase H-like HicB family nuclease